MALRYNNLTDVCTQISDPGLGFPPTSLLESLKENSISRLLRTTRWRICQWARRCAGTCRQVSPLSDWLCIFLTIPPDHCIEILRLNTQCYADIGLFTLYMVEGDPLAWPELNTRHVCRNFDGVRQWALDHSVGNMEVIQ